MTDELLRNALECLRCWDRGESIPVATHLLIARIDAHLAQQPALTELVRESERLGLYEPAASEPAAPKRDREADRARFPDQEFNLWLDESISDAGHIVWDQIGSVCDAWHGWDNRYPFAPPPADRAALSDDEIIEMWSPHPGGSIRRPILGRNKIIAFARAVIAATQEQS